MKQLFLVWLILIAGTAYSQVFVAPSGSDNNDGRIERPLATVAMAVRRIREMRRLNDTSIQKGIDIIVEDGVYNFYEPLFIRPEDSGTEESPTTIKAAPGARPVFSGGLVIKGWKKLQSKVQGLPASSFGKIWVADLSQTEIANTPFRELWVNGDKAIRAKDTEGDHMNRILSWDHFSQTCWIPKPKNFNPSLIGGMEMFIHQWWAIAILRIKSVKVSGDSVQLSFLQPESRIESEHPWPAPWISKKTGNSAFYLTNSIQFLDKPGEWFYDQSTRKLYYYPWGYENMSTASVVAPFLETIVKVEGAIDRPVTNFSFDGISFQYSNWTRPSLSGHVPLQAGMYLVDAYKLKVPGTPDKKGLENQAWIGRPIAAMDVSYANHIHFENCRFEHLSSTGLDLRRGTHDDVVKGNLFKDIGGSGILIGTFSDESFETHFPYNPKDEREVCSNELISNNLITDVTNEDWGCVGIGAGYVRNVNIEHNEVCDVSYTGVSLGWGWTKNENVMKDNHVVANKISHYAKHMYDVAGIYTLSAQPGTVIEKNCIDSIYQAYYAHDPNHWFYLYTDEGSSYITVKDNWCPEERFLQNANGPGNVWERNGEKIADIKEQAGLEGKFRFLLADRVIDKGRIIESYRTSITIERNLPKTHPAIIEIILLDSARYYKQMLNVFNRILGYGIGGLYRWNNHYVNMVDAEDSSKLIRLFNEKLPGSKVKIYTQLVYEFDRKSCKDSTEPTSNDVVWLSANLVSDLKLQQEYLDYHAHQYEQWPEVSQGFCNARFQELQVYKNGRQLMLLIDYPHGAKFEELNAKTTENNPRMIEWNNLMKKYQEGIDGAKPGEVWVQFLPIIK